MEGSPAPQAAQLPPLQVSPPLPQAAAAVAFSSSSSSSKGTEPQRQRNPKEAQMRRGQEEGARAIDEGEWRGRVGGRRGPAGRGGGGGGALVGRAPGPRRLHLPGQGAGAARRTPRGRWRLGMGGRLSPGAAKCKQSAMISLFS